MHGIHFHADTIPSTCNPFWKHTCPICKAPTPLRTPAILTKGLTCMVNVVVKIFFRAMYWRSRWPIQSSKEMSLDNWFPNRTCQVRRGSGPSQSLLWPLSAVALEQSWSLVPFVSAILLLTHPSTPPLCLHLKKNCSKALYSSHFVSFVK